MNVFFTLKGSKLFIIIRMQIKIDDVIYMNFTSAVPLEWANELRVTDDVYLHRIDFWNIFTDEVTDIVVVKTPS